MAFNVNVKLSADGPLTIILEKGVNALQSSAITLAEIASTLSGIALDLKILRESIITVPSDAVEISVTQGVSNPQKENVMAAKKAKCTVTKSSPPKAMAKAGPAVKLADGVFQLLDGGSGLFTTMGVNQAGEQVAIDTVATETVVSDNPSLVVSTPTGMAVTLTPPTTGTGSANVTWTATWNDGSVGPFTFSASVTWSGGAITGITVNQS